MPRRYRILHMITKLELGGAQQNTLYCAAHHDRTRFETHLLAGAGGMLDDEARAIGDARVDLVPWLVHPIEPRRDVEALWRLRALLRERRIDLVHTHSSKAGLLGRIAAHLAGVPVVVHTAHGWSFNDTQTPARRAAYVAFERLAARLSRRLFVVSHVNRDQGLAAGVGRAHQYEVVHSGIDTAAWSVPRRPRADVRAELGFDASHRVVGSVACLKPQKAPLDWVRAAAAAHARDPRLRFFLAGGGELQADVEAEVQRLDAGAYVRLLGWRRDVVELLHAADAFLLTSLFEGLPRSVLQAMAAGVPVVATAVDGTPEVVEDGVTGLLVPPGDPAAAAAALSRLFADDLLRRRCVDAARGRLVGDFDSRAMVRTLERIYLELLDSRTVSR